MIFFDKIFNKNKNVYKISSSQENSLVVMLKQNKKIKLKSKINVPENFCVVVLSRERFLDVLPSGVHELNGLTIEKTCNMNKLDKPTKKGYKKEFVGDFYFVNLNTFKFTNNLYIKKKNVNNDFSLEFKIDNAIKFLKFLAQEKIVFKDDFAFKHLSFCLLQLFYYYNLDNKEIDEAKFEEYIKKKLSKIGITLVSFNVKITKASFEEENKNNSKYANTNESINNGKVSIEENKTVLCADCCVENKDTNENVEQANQSTAFLSKSSVVNLEEIKAEKISYFVCDCGAKLPSSSLVCYNCKKSFVEKNTCEYCGKEIPKGIYVCPYCNSVLFGN